MTQRWKITIEYDGTNFCGWQRQNDALSVQECIERAITLFCGEKVKIHAAGRTDAGVHASMQVAHFDLEQETYIKAVRDAINFHLRPHPIVVVEAEPVAQNFHARFSAIHRAYRYRILMSRIAEPMIDANRVWHIRKTLDVDAMNAAARHLVGTHDFSSFRAIDCQAKSPIRTLDRLEWIEENHCFTAYGRHIVLYADARSFLHHQIRNIAGTLKAVGEGKWTPDDVKEILEARDRTRAGITAPAAGLCFTQVAYQTP